MSSEPDLFLDARSFRITGRSERSALPDRSIPAHAGEQCIGTRSSSSAAVYPRARGGAC